MSAGDPEGAAFDTPSSGPHGHGGRVRGNDERAQFRQSEDSEESLTAPADHFGAAAANQALSSIVPMPRLLPPVPDLLRDSWIWGLI